MGFDDAAWRMDDTVHPFATADRRRRRAHHHALGRALLPHRPVRGDARVRPRPVRGRASPPALRRTPLGVDRVAGDARVPEPPVGEHGRPRSAVLRGARAADRRAGRRRAGRPRRATPCTAPSTGSSPPFIRVEADEATYALHIILRFELEQELIDGTLAVTDLPEAWNARFEEYFGIEVTDDADGVLQDVHWSAGLIGYFPTYALGNLIAGQLWERAHADLPDLDGRPRRRRARPAARVAAASTSTATARSSRPRSCWSARPADRSRWRRSRSYLKDKLGDVYGFDLAADTINER